MDFILCLIFLLRISNIESIPVSARSQRQLSSVYQKKLELFTDDTKNDREFGNHFSRTKRQNKINVDKRRSSQFHGNSKTFRELWKKKLPSRSFPRRFFSYPSDRINPLADNEFLLVDEANLVENIPSFSKNEIKVIPKETVSVTENEGKKVISVSLQNGGHEIIVFPKTDVDFIPELESDEADFLNQCDNKTEQCRNQTLEKASSVHENALRLFTNISVGESNEFMVENVSESAFVEGSGEELDLDIKKNVPVESSKSKESRFVQLFADNNETATACVTPGGEPGHCRHFKQCILHEVLNNFNMYLQYMCLRSTSVGICCPDNPVIEISNPEDRNVTNSPVIENKPFEPEEGCGINTRNRIVGGEISKPSEWTWMVALLRRNRFFCGGVLINSRYVLTAAHCTLGVNIKDLKVRLGEYNFNTKMEHQEDIAVSDVKRHAKFTTLTFQHDIALLKLRHHVTFSQAVKSICLPDNETNDFAGINATVVGWGTVSFGGAASPILRQVTIPVWKNSECDRAYVLENIDESFLCAGSAEEEQDACQGDSGGPLMSLNDQKRWQVIGLVSWGRRCGDPNYPGVYTRITSYLGWISDNIQS